MRKLLLVNTMSADPREIRRRVRDHVGDDEVDVRVVAPASKLSILEWLASDESAARRDAAEIAEATAEELDSAPSKRAEGRVGDVDPVQAIEDALRTFPADEIVIVTPPRDEKTWLEKGAPQAALDRFALPVTHLVVDE